MSLLGRKLRRELWSQRGQVAAIVAVTSLGVFLFLSSAAGYLDLRDSYSDTRERLALADLHVSAPALTDEQLRRVAAADGVEVAEARVVTALPVVTASGSVAHVELRVLSLPDEGEPALDRVLLLSGALPASSDEVLLEQHLAKHHDLERGDVVRVRAPGFERTLTVSGVAASAEYLWVARDENDVFPSPDAFGVGWMRRAALREVTSSLLRASPSASEGLAGVAVAAGAGPGNELLLERAPGASWRQVESAVREVLGPGHAPVRESALPGVKLLQMDVDGYKGMAAFFPFFFLAVGAFILASILTRLVDAQRQVIGTLSALGVSRARVLGHYLSWALVLGAGGSLLGAALGIVSGRALTHEYAKELGIPFVTARLHWDLALYGVLLGTTVALLSGLLPAYRAAGLRPAEAMRPSRPAMGALARVARRLRAPLPLRMAVRGVLGRPFRSAGTALGVSAALVLVLTTGALLDSMRVMLDTLFHKAQTFDERVELIAPLPAAEVQERFGAIPGTSRVEGALVVPVQLGGDDRWREALLQGLPDDGTLLRSMDLDGTPVPPTKNGVVLSRALARSLGVEPGDALSVRAGSSRARFTVSALGDAVMGPVASARLRDVQRALGVGDAIGTVLIAAEPGQATAVHDAIAALPWSARVQDLAALRARMHDLMGLGWLMLGAMLLFSVVLAAAILFNTATLNILERTREQATLRALGRTLPEIALGLTLEHATLALLGFAIGLPLAQLATRHVLSLFSSELFSLPYVMTPSTVLAAAAGIVLVLLLAQWPGLRSIARTPLSTAVRSREG